MILIKFFASSGNPAQMGFLSHLISGKNDVLAQFFPSSNDTKISPFPLKIAPTKIRAGLALLMAIEEYESASSSIFCQVLPPFHVIKGASAIKAIFLVSLGSTATSNTRLLVPPNAFHAKPLLVTSKMPLPPNSYVNDVAAHKVLPTFSKSVIRPP
ncbi:MAG: hypothetical protein ACD_15C00029G0003 [uncultured bacterium]|nr:MAG: hypothetical protein ACD_15C00029G0003 [uncultured bacterium]